MSNIHTHTTYCDGTSDPIEFVSIALELGWKHLGFSAHAPLPFDCEWDIPVSQIENYVHEISALQNHYQHQLNIHTGWEVDYLHGKGIHAFNFDTIKNAEYHILSIHYLPAILSDGRIIEYVEIDGKPEEFNRLLFYYDHNLKTVLDLYLENLDAMFEFSSQGVKIIGHIDKIVVNAELHPDFKKLHSYFYSEIERLLIKHKSKGYTLEINTRSIYKKLRSAAYPNYQVIGFASKNDIPLILNSDAHHFSELNLAFDKVQAELKSMKIFPKWFEWSQLEEFLK